MSLTQTRNELTAISRASHDRFATHLDANNTSKPRLFVKTLIGNLAPTFNTLLNTVTFVLLIAYTNMTALFLSHLTSHQKEIAIRQSLGTTHSQIIQQFIIKSFVFSIVTSTVNTLLAL